MLSNSVSGGGDQLDRGKCISNGLRSAATETAHFSGRDRIPAGPEPADGQSSLGKQPRARETHPAVTFTFQTKELKKDKQSPVHTITNHQPSGMDVQVGNADASTLRLAPPSTIPGLKPAHKYNVLGSHPKPRPLFRSLSRVTPGAAPEKGQSQQSTPSSDESNSPTEMNSYKRMTEKPPLIKRLTMGLTGNHHNPVSGGRCRSRV